MRELNFTIDSALLSELGERLVGKPHIALAELVKNSYDADATKVIVRFVDDRIEVHDNGHGMDFDEFRSFWMRIGTPHKQEKRVSRKLERPMTGSKGVGRLAVQFLANKIALYTVSGKNQSTELSAHVNWDEAVKAGDLTKAVARYEETSVKTRFPNDSRHGTAIILSGLKQEWTAEAFEELGREIWWLQPPFRSSPDLTTDAQQSFEVELESPDTEAVQKFNTQMWAILELWHARLVGKLVEVEQKRGEKIGTVQLALEFAGKSPEVIEYEVPDCKIHAVEYEIRVFHLQYRQRHGIKVDVARDYLNEYGGIHVYDTGFHLPYYGKPENDWLKIEIDHSHRRSRARLLPEQFQVPEGLSFLPTLSRLLGVVHVNTSKEHEKNLGKRETSAEDYLQISVTRDRLVENKAYDSLWFIVRWALEYYAMQEKKRQLAEAEARKPVEPASEKFERVDQILDQYEGEIPRPVFKTLRKQVREAIDASEAESKILTTHVGLLGALATAGISALAYQHEVGQQFRLLEDIVGQLGRIRTTDQKSNRILEEIRNNLSEWLERAQATRALFSPLLDEENRAIKTRHPARKLINEIRMQMGVLMRGIDIGTTGVYESLRLPPASFAEWSAIFQNVFLNAVNAIAMLDSKTKKITVSSRIRGKTRAILVQDTGSGIDLSSANELFEPFVRKLKLSPERRGLGFGGTGLGLTIVRMIAENLDCKVAFVEPDDGFNTAFQLSWSEKE